MSAGMHKDRIGRDKQDVSDLDSEMVYMTRLSREVSRACDAYWERITGKKPLTMKDMVTGYAKSGKRRRTRINKKQTLL